MLAKLSKEFSINTRVLKFGISEGLARVAPFLSAMYVASTLPAEKFGTFSLFVATFEILYIVVSFNIQATTRIDYFKLSESELARRKLIHILFSLSISVAAVLIGVFQTFLTMTEVLILVASAFSRTIVAFILALLQCSERVNKYILIHQSFTLTLAVGTVYFVGLGMGVAGWFLAISIASALQLGIALSSKPKDIGFGSVSSVRHRSEWLSVIGHAALFMPQSIGWWLKSSADRFIIASFIGLNCLGVYALAFQISSTVIVGITAINLAIVPSINRSLLQDDYSTVRRAYGGSALAAVIGTALVILFGEIAINNFFGAQYQEAKLYLPWICASMLPQALTLVLINELYFRSSAMFVAKTIVAVNSGQTVINVFVVANFGIVEMIVVSLIANLTMLGLVIRKIRGIRRFRGRATQATV